MVAGTADLSLWFCKYSTFYIPNISKLSEDCEGNKDLSNNFFSYLWLARQTIFPVTLYAINAFLWDNWEILADPASQSLVFSLCLLISLYFSRLFRSQTDNDDKRALYLVWRVVCKQQSSKLWRLCRGGLYANSFLMEEGGGNWLDWSFLITISIISPPHNSAIMAYCSVEPSRFHVSQRADGGDYFSLFALAGDGIQFKCDHRPLAFLNIAFSASKRTIYSLTHLNGPPTCVGEGILH